MYSSDSFVGAGQLLLSKKVVSGCTSISRARCSDY